MFETQRGQCLTSTHTTVPCKLTGDPVPWLPVGALPAVQCSCPAGKAALKDNTLLRPLLKRSRHDVSPGFSLAFLMLSDMGHSDFLLKESGSLMLFSPGLRGQTDSRVGGCGGDLGTMYAEEKIEKEHQQRAARGGRLCSERERGALREGKRLQQTSEGDRDTHTDICTKR